MSAPDPARTSQLPLLLVVDPAARHWDGESVRIARDVLGAGAPEVKVCLPESPEETERALARRGARRPVVVGDDAALHRVVRLLYRERELADAALSVVPVGPPERVALTCGLGVPGDTVAAARTVLDGVERPQGLLTDDSGGVVLGDLRIPDLAADRGGSGSPEPAGAAREAPGKTAQPGIPGLSGLSRTRRSLTRSVRAVRGRGLRGDLPVPPQRLRVEADGVLLADLDEPVRELSVRPLAGTVGLAQVTVRPQGGDGSRDVRVQARAVTVSGPDFRYRADAVTGGPVRVRTWTARAGAWRLTLPA